MEVGRGREGSACSRGRIRIAEGASRGLPDPMRRRLRRRLFLGPNPTPSQLRADGLADRGRHELFGRAGYPGAVPPVHGGDFPLHPVPRRQDGEAEYHAAQARGHARRHRPQARSAVPLVPGLPQRGAPGPTAPREWRAHRLLQILSPLRAVPRGQAARLAGGGPRQADGRVERQEAVSPLRPLPQPPHAPLQAPQAPAPALHPAEINIPEGGRP